ncbi:Imidazolonepropionase [bioreactor metagenome]|uniref:Imidazolonepropionase n=1 Tax=bioreactor metagenome TaxID=1076179 RepID=A0A644SWA6_9ZZZZ|nr:amidohydrolase [Negativicutes bacterium]
MIALTGGTIFTMCGQSLKGGTILIDDGKIIAVGAGIKLPDDCKHIDVAGKVVTPGLIDAHTHLGVYAESLDWSGEDVNEISDPVTPALDVIDALNPADVGLAEAVGGGITTVMVAPGSANPIGGQCMIIKTRPRSCVEQMIVKRYAGLKVAFGENPRRAYGDKKKMPVTRMATAALIRETLQKGREYLAKVDSKDHKFDYAMEAIVRVLRREMPIRAHAHRADDISTALRIATEFDLDIIIEHATEGHLIADVLAEHQARVVLGPLMITKAKLELKESSWRAPALLAEHGVLFALMSDHPVVPSKFLPVYAGIAARFGLPEEDALKAITINAAKILGLQDRIGSIEPGKDADLVVWSEHPLLLAAKPEWVLIDGQIGQVDAEQRVAAWNDFGHKPGLLGGIEHV